MVVMLSSKKSVPTLSSSTTQQIWSFFDPVSDGDEFARAPEQSVRFDRTHLLLQLGHIRLVVPRLDIEDDVGLGDEGALFRLLLRLACVVGGDAFCFDLLSFCRRLFVLRVRTEQVDIV